MIVAGSWEDVLLENWSFLLGRRIAMTGKLTQWIDKVSKKNRNSSAVLGVQKKSTRSAERNVMIWDQGHWSSSIKDCIKHFPEEIQKHVCSFIAPDSWFDEANECNILLYKDFPNVSVNIMASTPDDGFVVTGPAEGQQYILYTLVDSFIITDKKYDIKGVLSFEAHDHMHYEPIDCFATCHLEHTDGDEYVHDVFYIQCKLFDLWFR